MASKQQQAKVKQGYIEKPILPICSNCRNMKTETTYPDPNYPDYCKTNDTCIIGDFKVKRNGTCNNYEQKP